MNGTTIVVSPLLALQYDQTSDLNSRGIKSASLNSTTGKKDTKLIKDALKDATLKLLYVAPETLLNEELLCFLSCEASISHIVIDEAHAMVESSQDFRPKYKELGILKEYFPEIPFTTLTATASPEDIQEVVDMLDFSPEYDKYFHNLDRPNLTWNVLRKTDEITQLMSLLTRYKKGSAGLIYCNTKEKCKTVSEYLNRNGYKSEYFYSTVSKKEKKRIQDAFLNNEVDIIVATSAFGTGINKPNVRFVINLDVPSGMNDLLQQGGRAGRDGLASHIFTIYSPVDVNKLKYILRMSISSPVRLTKAYAKLQKIIDHCTDKKTCRRVLLLNHYGQTYGKDDCGSCDNCLRMY